ncbi:MAG TPA: MFS transporter [Gaiellaceae bacterium]|jgi:EmrB/QacA subfamily drug resistance transporter
MLRNTLLQDERKRRGAVLRVMCLALMMVVASVASLNVALPGIARDTGATQTQLQWIVDVYALVFAALLLPAGAIGDRVGRKPILALGLFLFGAASLVAIFVHSPSELIALRAVMGAGAALVMPVTLSVITTIFPPQERGKAVGTWVGVAAGGGVLGLLASGLLLEWLSWPSVFALNVVLATLALIGTLAIVPATRESRPPRLDPVGTLLSVLGLASLVFGIIEGPERGWTDLATVASLSAGLVGLVLFVLWELRRREPMLDPRNFLLRGFGAGSVSISVQFFAAFGFLFLILPYLQLVMGLSPLRASAAILPMAAVVIPLSRFAPAVAARVGVRVAGATGLALMATGFVILTTLDLGASYWHFLAGLLPFGAGMALAGAPATTAIVASLPREKQGVASAVNDVSRELGGALGIAVLGSLMNGAYRASMADSTTALPGGLADRARGSLAAAEQIGSHLGAQGHLLIVHAQSAFLDGLSRGLLGGAVVLLLGALFVAIRAPGRAESRANATAAADFGRSSVREAL